LWVLLQWEKKNQGRFRPVGSDHSLVSGKRFTDDEDVETEVRKWLRQQSKEFYVSGFDVLLNRWEKCISVPGGYLEICVLQVRIPHVLHFI
jgi:hypothetical protein